MEEQLSDGFGILPTKTDVLPHLVFKIVLWLTSLVSYSNDRKYGFFASLKKKDNK